MSVWQLLFVLFFVFIIIWMKRVFIFLLSFLIVDYHIHEIQPSEGWKLIGLIYYISWYLKSCSYWWASRVQILSIPRFEGRRTACSTLNLLVSNKGIHVYSLYSSTALYSIEKFIDCVVMCILTVNVDGFGQHVAITWIMWLKLDENSLSCITSSVRTDPILAGHSNFCMCLRTTWCFDSTKTIHATLHEQYVE